MAGTNKLIVSNNFQLTTINIQCNIKSIFDKNNDLQMTNIIDYPKCSLGFHHYIHSLRKDKEILKQFENKKKVYIVTNSFEIEIDNYEESIKQKINNFLNIKEKIPQIISLDFYKTWEIYFMFDIIDNTKSFKTLTMSDNGSVMQSLIHFREKYSKEYKNDIYNILKINETNLDVKLSDLDKNFTEYYGKKIDIKTDFKEKYDLIIGCGNILEGENENTFEQDYFKILLIQINNAFKYSKKNSNFIVKIFETYTNLSAKIIALLLSSYEKVFIVKPLTSKPSHSEKYIVCIGFKVNETDIKKVEKIYNKLNDNNKLKVIDIFTEYEINKELKLRLIEMNRTLSNNLFKSIGKIVNFVNSQNYYGDEYQNYREEQINANIYWVLTFLPESKDFKDNKKIIMENSILSNKMILDNLGKLDKIIV
jgi:23S rRNA U2552 (ribose-2'-O)-methylase RlmE/FtsJ